MNIIEKRDYIHNHLHLADSDFIEDIYKKMHTSIKSRKVIIGYDANGNQISSAQFLSELKEAERQIKQGEFITLEQLEKESDEW
jgi:hypothetical protein